MLFKESRLTWLFCELIVLFTYNLACAYFAQVHYLTSVLVERDDGVVGLGATAGRDDCSRTTQLAHRDGLEQ